MLYIESKEQFDQVIANGTVLVDFFATWCGPCKMLSPVLEKVSAEVSDVTIAKVDVDKVPMLAQQFGIMSIPTMILFVNGVNQATTMGYMNEDQVKTFISSNR